MGGLELFELNKKVSIQDLDNASIFWMVIGMVAAFFHTKRSVEVN